MSATDHADEATLRNETKKKKKKDSDKSVLLTAKGCPTSRLALPAPLSGWMPACLPLHLHRPLPLSLPLPLRILLLHGDVKLVVDARVLLVENDLWSESITADQGENER